MLSMSFYEPPDDQLSNRKHETKSTRSRLPHGVIRPVVNDLDTLITRGFRVSSKAMFGGPVGWAWSVRRRSKQHSDLTSGGRGEPLWRVENWDCSAVSGDLPALG